MSLDELLAGRPCDASLRGRRVLVVEDDCLLALDLLEELRRCGAVVVGPVGTVAEALGLLESGAGPHLAILDIKLRDGLAYPVADALRARGVPFLFASGIDPAAIPAAYAGVALAQKPVALRGGASPAC